ncbi:MAG: hypothetical protein GC158_07975 [Cyanobacteria bacterium RI_101]|nr:hypothetical protein [Cyanobacteria bacterium RI_101]
MTAWLQLLPTPILIFIAALMIVPSAVAIWVRFSLYHTLKALSQNLKHLDTGKIEEIKQEFKRSAARLDFTNTTDILEKFYSQEKLFGLSYDYWDNFCQLLPNLLIAFGLLGTFLGITFNLGDISAILNQDADGASLVVANLKAPLQSMGIAFITSLVAISLSSLLTILNLFWNTETAKYNLFINLEKHLEIDFSPVESHIEAKAKSLLNTILYGQKSDNEHSLESVLTTVLKNFVPSLTTSIKSFTSAVNTFETQVGIMKTSAESIEKSFGKLEAVAKSFSGGAESFSGSAVEIKGAAASIKNNQEALFNWANELHSTQAQFAETIKELINSGQVKINDFTTKIQELINSNSNASNAITILSAQLQQSGERFEKSSQNYLNTAESLAVSQFPECLKEASENLDRFSQFTASLSETNKSFAQIIQDFQTTIPTLQTLGESAQRLNQQSGKIITLNQQRLIQEEKELAAIQGKLAALIELMKESQAQSLSTLQDNVNALITTFSQEMEINAQKLQDLYQGMKTQTQRTEQIQGELVKLTGNFSQGLEQINDQGQSGARQLEAVQGSLSALVNVFKQYQDSLNLKQDLIDLSQRLALTLSQDSQKQTQEIGELMALESRKNKQETANLSHSLNVSLSHLEDISLKLSKLTSLIQDLNLPQNPR